MASTSPSSNDAIYHPTPFNVHLKHLPVKHDDFKTGDQLWLVRVPKTIKPSDLHDARIDLNSPESTVKVNKTKYTVRKLKRGDKGSSSHNLFPLLPSVKRSKLKLSYPFTGQLNFTLAVNVAAPALPPVSSNRKPFHTIFANSTKQQKSAAKEQKDRAGSQSKNKNKQSNKGTGLQQSQTKQNKKSKLKQEQEEDSASQLSTGLTNAKLDNESTVSSSRDTTARKTPVNSSGKKKKKTSQAESKPHDIQISHKDEDISMSISSKSTKEQQDSVKKKKKINKKHQGQDTLSPATSSKMSSSKDIITSPKSQSNLDTTSPPRKRPKKLAAVVPASS
eukprot:gene225-3604_t